MPASSPPSRSLPPAAPFSSHAPRTDIWQTAPDALLGNFIEIDRPFDGSDDLSSRLTRARELLDGKWGVVAPAREKFLGVYVGVMEMYLALFADADGAARARAEEDSVAVSDIGWRDHPLEIRAPANERPDDDDTLTPSPPQSPCEDASNCPRNAQEALKAIQQNPLYAGMLTGPPWALRKKARETRDSILALRKAIYARRYLPYLIPSPTTTAGPEDEAATESVAAKLRSWSLAASSPALLAAQVSLAQQMSAYGAPRRHSRRLRYTSPNIPPLHSALHDLTWSSPSTSLITLPVPEGLERLIDSGAFSTLCETLYTDLTTLSSTINLADEIVENVLRQTIEERIKDWFPQRPDEGVPRTWRPSLALVRRARELSGWDEVDRALLGRIGRA